MEDSGSKSIRIPDLIGIKRDGKELSREHIQQFINDLLAKDLHDSQLGAMLMAMYLNGLNKQEVIGLTDAMLRSGETLSWPTEWDDVLVDKHSTGGVGDKVSLILAPALAACGMKVPMISGRSLGFTGGTLDKLESIPGFRTDLTPDEIKTTLESVGCCIVGQTETLAPADKIMYAVRDITGTVASVPLIVGSIISKKAAEGIKTLVLDVKCGKGTFSKTTESAEKLAHALVAVSEGLGLRTTAFITAMDDPIGRCIGNSLEVIEAIECLQGKGPKDLEELVAIFGGELLHLSNKVKSAEEGKKRILDSLDNETALEKFKQMLQRQKVSSDIAARLCKPGNYLYDILPLSKHKTELKVTCSGVISGIDSMHCAQVSSVLGAGRTQPGEPIAFDVGLQLLVSVGQYVKQDEAWVVVYHKGEILQKALHDQLTAAITVNEKLNSNQSIKSRLMSKVAISNVSDVVAFSR